MIAAAARTAEQANSSNSRDKLFLWVFQILAANSLAGIIIRALAENGVGAALLSTFGVSAIVWVALGAGLALLARSKATETAHSTDVALAIAACLLAMLPMANISSVALTAFAAYAIWTSNPGSSARRAGAIFLAVTANLIWGRLILGMFSRSFLFIDAFFVTNLIGAPQVGNTIPFIGHPGLIIVTPGCSSLQGISLAIVFWVTVNQWFELKTTPRSLSWCGLALLAATGINILRIAALVRFPSYFDEIHVGWGAQLASFSTMLVIVAIVLWGARRDICR